MAMREFFKRAELLDGKRLRCANRKGDGNFETATLIAHDTGLPLACRGFYHENRERSIMPSYFSHELKVLNRA